MKRLLLLAIFTMMVGATASAQNLRYLREGESQTAVLYKYPDFVNGQITLNNGTRSQGLLNYNLYTRTVQFKDDKGKVMDIADPSQVAFADMGGRRFVYRGGLWYEILGDFGDMSVVTNSFITLKEDNRSGGDYGGQSIASSSSRMRLYNEATGEFVIGTDQLFTFIEHSELYVVRKNKFYRTNKTKDMEKLFSKHKEELRNYIHTNHLDLEELTHVNQLLEYAISQGW